MSQTSVRSTATDAGPMGIACAFALMWWTLVGIVIAGAVMSGVLIPLANLEWWNGFVAASVITVPSALAGLFPVVLVSLRGAPGKIPMAFLAGTTLRLMTAFGLLLIANMLYSVPRTPTATLILLFYGVILGTEVVVLVSQMRRMFPSPSSKSGVALV